MAEHNGPNGDGGGGGSGPPPGLTEHEYKKIRRHLEQAISDLDAVAEKYGFEDPTVTGPEE